jgi:hypothetical protein
LQFLQSYVGRIKRGSQLSGKQGEHLNQLLAVIRSKMRYEDGVMETLEQVGVREGRREVSLMTKWGRLIASGRVQKLFCKDSLLQGGEYKSFSCIIFELYTKYGMNSELREAGSGHIVDENRKNQKMRWVMHILEQIMVSWRKHMRTLNPALNLRSLFVIKVSWEA